MIINYLKTAIRNLYRNKYYSLLNIIGLSIGVGIFLLVLYYVEYEFKYDQHFSDSERIFRITTDMFWENGDVQHTAVSSSATAEALLEDYPEVIASTRFIIDISAFVEALNPMESIAEKGFIEEVFYVDSSFYKVFKLTFKQGQWNGAHELADAIFLSASMADKYFPDKDPIGKQMMLNNSHSFVVKGVFEDIPGNSHLNFSILMDASHNKELLPSAWRDLSAYTYVLLNKTNDGSLLEGKLDDFILKYQEPYKDLLAFHVQPLLDIHLHSSNDFEMARTANRQILLVIMGIAALILLVACINFMNLTVARSLLRSREVGLRKVVGATRWKVILQFLGESILISFLAFVSGAVLAEMILPLFNDFTLSEVRPDYRNGLWKLAVLALTIGIVSGSYPAFYISMFQPAMVLKSGWSHSKKTGLFRRLLVTFQFTVTIVLLIATGIIYYQFSFIQNKDLGYSSEPILNVYFWNDSTHKYASVFEHSLREIPGISDICRSDYVPGGEPWYDHFWPEGSESHMPIRTANITEAYLPVIGLHLLQGRNFDATSGLDSATCIINEAAIKHFQWDEDEVLGKSVKFNFSNSWDEMITSRVIGVVKDFHYQSLHQSIEPIVLTTHDPFKPVVSMRISNRFEKEELAAVQTKFNELNYPFPFDYDFLEEKRRDLYTIDNKIATLVIIFSLLAIFIAGLGLLGLASFATEKRAREISVRRVFGATEVDVLKIFNKEFSVLVIIASVLAVPLSWIIMEKYLEQFVYRVSPAWWIFPLAALMAYLWAVGIVSLQTFRYARKNPAEVLKWE